MAERQSGGEHWERDDEPDDRPRDADVEQLASVGEDRAEPDERSHRADERRDERHRNEVGGRHVEIVGAGGEVVPELVRQEDRDERQREGEPRRPRLRGVLRERIGAGEEGEGVGVVRNRAGEHRTRERRRHQGREEQRDVNAPPFSAARERARQDEMAAVGLIGPVVAAGPLRERAGERGGGPRMTRMYKRVNDFPIPERDGPPRE
jgi:hypothetical protein